MVGLGSNCDTRGLEKPVLDLGPNGDTCMGFPNILEELTNPIRLEVGESSSLVDSRPTTHKAHDSVMVASSKMTTTEPKLMKAHDSSGSTKPMMKVGSTEPTITTGLATPVVMSRSDDDERSLSINQVYVVLPVGATQIGQREFCQLTSVGFRRWKCRGALSLF